jgi:hypothetical protein
VLHEFVLSPTLLVYYVGMGYISDCFEFQLCLGFSADVVSTSLGHYRL